MAEIDEIAQMALDEVDRGAAPFYVKMTVDALRECSGVHFCGGGYLYDAWPGALTAFALVTRIALRLGLPVSAAGISPLADTEIGFQILADIIRNLVVVDFRDAVDGRFSQLRADSTITCDNVWGVPDLSRPKSNKNQRRIHIQLINEPRYPELNVLMRQFLTHAIKKLSAYQDLDLHFINHVNGYHDFAEPDNLELWLQ